ncbi:MAG: cation diffusion facilitator family transporter [Gammaproteobacteria bacterium]|nr:cation diffusion facilitator family transporter [Gammaproteobacteria bacterium]MDH5653479.1 cation diffusion facilitator family transporter [Gammaproteobacteria bacterium]
MSHPHHHHHHTPSAKELNSARYRETVKVTLIGSAVDLSLGVAKLVVGYLAHSTALIADGVHSLSDLFTDAIVLYAAKHSHVEADEEHPYGHGRIETVATVLLGLALLAVAIGITWDAVNRMFHPEKLWVPGMWALVVAVISIISKEAIYHYSMRIARKYRSNMLKANAWHSRTDAFSSVIVVIGVAGAMAGLNYLDAVAAVGVAVMIAKIAWDLSWHSLRELIDTGLEPGRVEEIRQSILAISGVKTLHILRTRLMGGEALVDVHIQVQPQVSVSEGHQISETVRQTLIREYDEISDVMVHIDPEDDEMHAPNAGLPLREEIISKLEEKWGGIDAAVDIEDITLHYLEGKINVELLLPLSRIAHDPQSAAQLADEFARVADEMKEIGEIKLYYH